MEIPGNLTFIISIFIICWKRIFMHINKECVFVVIENTKITGHILAISDESSLSISRLECAQYCISVVECQTASWHIQGMQCTIHSVSGLHLAAQMVKDKKWLTMSKTGWYPIAKFSTVSLAQNFQGLHSYELWSSADETHYVNDSDACTHGNVSEKCLQHYVHPVKNHILSLKIANKIKLSFYKSGSEQAWITFDNPGTDEASWFQPSNIIASYPWDTQELRDSQNLMSLAPNSNNDRTRIYLAKANSEYGKFLLEF